MFTYAIYPSNSSTSKIEEKPPFPDDPDDYAVVIDGPVVDRIYPNPVHQSKWNWALQSPVGATGHTDTLDDAKAELKHRWFAETKKLSQL